MEFGVLGPLQVIAGDGQVVLGPRQQQAVLALLLLQAPEPVSRDRLIDELWGERPPASAAHAIQVYVSGLRKLLRGGGHEGFALSSSPAGYALEVDPERIDARRFERLVGAAQQAVPQDPARAEDLFAKALGLWRGTPLAELGQFEFARLEADRLEDLRAAAVEGLVEVRIERGEHAEVIGQVTALVAADPLRERPRRLLMLALYRSGRHAQALAAYRDACAALDEIGLQPGPELRALEQAILRHDAALLAAEQAPAQRSTEREHESPRFGDLPSSTRPTLPAAAHPLIGRRSEQERIHALLARDDVRLVTLLGPGGSGKTRLALEVATKLRNRYRDGAWFVSLAPLSDPTLVASEIASAVGVKEAEGQPPMAALCRALARRELLLVVDNFEHLIAAAEVVSQLLAAAPKLDVLATSREPLRVGGEHRLQIPPLPVPDAAQLFMERARAVRADLETGALQHQTVERICERLDGLPLALELAAARVALFSIPALEGRLAQRLDLPEGARDLPDRQRTLRATIDWSYQLLSATEQTLFRGLAPFAGGARLDAIESIFIDLDSEPIDVVAALVDKSLLRRRDDPDGLPRFWMLDTIREYASQRLANRPDAATITVRQADYFREFAEDAERKIHTADQRIMLERLEADHVNLRAALDHLAASNPSAALRMAAALGFFWEIRGHLSEGRERLDRSLASAGNSPARAMATFHAGRLAFLEGEGSESERIFTEALRLAREVHETRAEALALMHLGVLAQNRGDTAGSEELHGQALVVAKAGSDQWTLRMALNDLGDTLAEAGEAERAQQVLEQALEISRRLGEPYGTAMVTGNLAQLALERGDLDAAQPLIAECLHNAREIRYESITAWALTLEALMALKRGEFDLAVCRLNESIELLRNGYDRAAGPLAVAAAATLAAARNETLIAAQLWGALHREMSRHVIQEAWLVTSLRDEWLPRIRSAISASDWDEAWDRGTRLNPEQALHLAAQ